LSKLFILLCGCSHLVPESASPRRRITSPPAHPPVTGDGSWIDGALETPTTGPRPRDSVWESEPRPLILILILILIGYCFVLKVQFLNAFSHLTILRDPDTFSWSPLPYACICGGLSAQGMHQDLMFIARKGTRQGLASWGKALV